MLQRDEEMGVTVMHLSVYHGTTRGVLPLSKTERLVREFLGYVEWLADPGNMGRAIRECI
jgi:hypothetical protein